VHAPCEDKSNNAKDSLYGEVGLVFYQVPWYDITILLGDFSVRVDREDIFKLTIRNESPHKINNDNDDRVELCNI
jgi:hypothetical protein